MVLLRATVVVDDSLLVVSLFEEDPDVFDGVDLGVGVGFVVVESDGFACSLFVVGCVFDGVGVVLLGGVGVGFGVVLGTVRRMVVRIVRAKDGSGFA